MAFHLPQEETLDAAGLAEHQRRRLTAMLVDVLERNRFYREKLGRLGPEEAAERFEALPLTTRAEIERDQLEHPPYGTNLTYPVVNYSRLHQTSGSTGEPLRWLDRAEDWEWWKKCWTIIYRAASVRADDRFLFPFSFGPFIGFWGAFETAASLGNLCLPAGGMTTAARLRFMLENAATVVCCTPTYALRMAGAAAELGIDLAASNVRGLIVAGEPGGSLPATRGMLERAWGARVFDHAGMTEIGPYGFECEEAPGGVHIMESEFIAEVIDPQSARAVADGQEGELVLTNLGRWGGPLIRYRTGDLVRVVRGRCACGRSFSRMVGGILGRVDEMVFIRGNNVYPGIVEDLVRGVGGVAEFRCELGCRGAMSDLRIEVEPVAGEDGPRLIGRITEAIKGRLNFSPSVSLAEAGSLPRFEMKACRWVRSERDG